MNWKPLSEEPKERNKPIILIKYREGIFFGDKIAIHDSWDKALDTVPLRMNPACTNNVSYTHWAYFNEPK